MIFEDPTGYRWKATLSVFAAILACIVLFFTAFVGSIFLSPYLPDVEVDLDGPSSVALVPPSVTPPSTLPSSAMRPPSSSLYTPSSSFVSSTPDIWRVTKSAPLLTTAIVAQNDPESVRSVTDHLSDIDIVLPDWYVVTQTRCDVDARISTPLLSTLRSSDVSIVARVRTEDQWTDYTSLFVPILENSRLRSCFSRMLAERAKDSPIRGLHLDIRNLPPSSGPAYAAFVTDLATLLHAQNQILPVTLPSRDARFPLADIAQTSDAVIVPPLVHSERSSPSVLISTLDDQIRDRNRLLRWIPAQKMIVALDAYAYDWKQAPVAAVRDLRYPDAMALADQVNALPELSPATGNTEFEYVDKEKATHHVWIFDAVPTWNAWITARREPLLGFAVWRTGWEDPSVWSFVSNPNAEAKQLVDAASLATHSILAPGEITRITTTPRAGRRLLAMDEAGAITTAKYATVPTGYSIDRVGPLPSATSVFLTFEDGPDPKWTPQILDLLDRYHASSTFFVIGREAKKYPDLMKRIASSGSLIGNHTYTHAPFASMSEERLGLELNATQRIITSSFGKKTILFRPPMNDGRAPTDPAVLHALQHVNAMGYVTVASGIDSRDWTDESPEQMVKDIEQQLASSSDRIIAFHDGPGDRSRVVATLALLLPRLEKQGYRVAPLSEALRLPENAVNPPLEQKESILSKLPRALSAFQKWSWFAIVWLFRITLAISALRLIGLGVLVIRSVRRSARRRQYRDPSHIFVSVLIPAYNEEKTIEKTIRTLQQSDHHNFEALVIDDGSTDNTAKVVKALQVKDARIQLVTKPNGGKSSALNLGFERAKSDIVVTVDADTILHPETVTELIRPFADPKVDAVCGNVEVGNVTNLLTGFQSLEYITTQNFDRRAFDELNCISVVPGATGAWRRNRVIELGGYANDTLTEDADITLRLLRHGGKIVYASAARSLTEAPENVSALAKQRFRWSFGTFQCLSKHWDAFFHGALGWVALPNMLMFQIIFPILSPVGDLVFLITLLRGELRPILTGYILFLLMDLGGSLLAFSLEKKPKKLMWLILIQRFYYRQFMYVITFRSILAILRGQRYGWNKLKRLGSVNAPAGSSPLGAPSPSSASQVLTKE